MFKSNINYNKNQPIA